MTEHICPYCMSPIKEHERARVCASCGSVHHEECWEENRGCCVKDCPQVSRVIDLDVPTQPPEKLVLSKETVESARPRASASVSNPCMRCGRQVPHGELYCPECAPGPAENQDARNLGPILVMLAVLAVLLAWIVVAGMPSAKPPEEVKPAGVTDTIDR
jgi:predicted nucleic acid-binding Zn ribbon protein